MRDALARHPTVPDGAVVRWYRTAEKREAAQMPVGPCPHLCDHRGTSVVGYGPDARRYALVRCDGCGCRGWCCKGSSEGWGWQRTEVRLSTGYVAP